MNSSADACGRLLLLKVTDLAPGYCNVAFLRNHAFAVGRTPDGTGEVLAHITFVRVFYHGKLLPEVSVADGQIQIYYAMPPGKDAQIYFFDFYWTSLMVGVRATVSKLLSTHKPTGIL